MAWCEAAFWEMVWRERVAKLDADDAYDRDIQQGEEDATARRLPLVNQAFDIEEWGREPISCYRSARLAGQHIPENPNGCWLSAQTTAEERRWHGNDYWHTGWNSYHRNWRTSPERWPNKQMRRLTHNLSPQPAAKRLRTITHPPARSATEKHGA